MLGFLLLFLVIGVSVMLMKRISKEEKEGNKTCCGNKKKK